jgi:prevent-host-death family protein
MVMKQTISRPYPAAPRTKRLNVSEAKSKLSQALRELDNSPTIIHNRGRDVAVLISVEDYEKLLAAERSTSAPTMRSFVEGVDELKQRFGGGAVLPPESMTFVPRNPFGRTTR